MRRQKAQGKEKAAMAKVDLHKGSEKGGGKEKGKHQDSGGYLSNVFKDT